MINQCPHCINNCRVDEAKEVKKVGDCQCPYLHTNADHSRNVAGSGL